MLCFLVSTELTSRLADEDDYRMEEMEMWLDRIEVGLSYITINLT